MKTMTRRMRCVIWWRGSRGQSRNESCGDFEKLLSLSFFFLGDHLFYFLNRKRWPPIMNDRMAVWADRSQIFDGVNKIFGFDTRQFPKVMNMDQPLRSFAIYFCQYQSANPASTSIVKN